MNARFAEVPLRFVLVAGVTMLSSTVVRAQTPPDLVRTAMIQSLDGETATIDVIAGLPGPLPEPAGLFDIASDFRDVARDVGELRSFRRFASLPVPIPMPAGEMIVRSLRAVATLPGPLPYPARGMVLEAAQAIAGIPGPLPMSVRRAVERSLKRAATTPDLPLAAREILLLTLQMVADLPGPLPEPLRHLVSLTGQLLADSAFARVAALEQKVAAITEAAPLLSLVTELRQTIWVITQPCDDCAIR